MRSCWYGRESVGKIQAVSGVSEGLFPRVVKKEGRGFESPAPLPYTMLAPKTPKTIWVHSKDYINSILLETFLTACPML